MMRQPETRHIRFIALATTVLVASLLAAVTMPSAQAGSPAPESARQADGPLADDTALPPPTAVPTAAPTVVNYRVCPYLMTRVPAMRINHSLANANNTYGWNLRCSPNQPPGPFNPIRQWLGLRDRGRAWHPLFNDIVWKCGCG
jgi:hypothetical protein